jgi:carotenoid cleavage dioxygenase
VAEPIHVPSKQPGHEGYLIMTVHLHDSMLAEVLVLEAGQIEKGPLARIKMPIRLRHQVHGSWVSDEALG